MPVFVRILILFILLALPARAFAEVLHTPTDIAEAIRKLKDNPDDRELLKTITFYYMNVSMDSLVSVYADRLLDLGKRTGDRDFCELYGHIAKASVYLEKNDMSYFAHIERARNIAESTDNLDAMLSVYNFLAIHYFYNHSDYYTAASYYYMALDCAKAIGDQRRISIILSNLSGTYIMMDDLAGLPVAERAYELSHKLGDPIPMYYSAYSLVNYYLLDNRPELAQKMLEETERLHARLELPDSNKYRGLQARIAETTGNSAEAFRLYREEMESFRDESIPFGEISSTYLNYARFLRKVKMPQDAIKVLEQGIERSGSDSKLWVSHFYRELVYACRDKGDLEKALDYSIRYQDSKDSLFTISRERTFQENRIRFDIESKERKIDEQKLELASSRHRIVVLVLITVAIAFLFAVFIYSYRRQRRLYRAIVLQNRDYAQREKLLLRQNKPRTMLTEEKTDDIISRFTSLMTEQKLYTEPDITVASVAERLETNRTYLSRSINDSTGKSFTQIVNDYRVREAIALLSDRERNLPLKQIASMAGFSSLSTFYSSFQTFTGMTPARYREQLTKV